MFKAYKYRLYPNDEQKEMFSKHFGCKRFVYNYALSRRIKHYAETGKSLSVYIIKKELPLLKEINPWLKEVNAQSLQCAIFDLDKAYVRFFKEKKGFPKFKSKHSIKQSFQCLQSIIINTEWKKISFPKIKDVKIKVDRKFNGIMKSCVISKTSTDKYFVSILVEDGKELPIPEKANINVSAVGIDLGIKHFAVLSTGDKIDNPREYRKLEKKLKHTQKLFSRKVKGSNNRSKVRLKLARIHEKISNRRNDFLHKLSSNIVAKNQSIAIEDLAVSNMVRNRCLSKSISDASWGTFRTMLEYKCSWYGKNLLVIGRYEPSSKICSCGVINKELKLSDRDWTCSDCGVTHNRDLLASQNILKMAFHPKNKCGGDHRVSACGATDISRSCESGSLK